MAAEPFVSIVVPTTGNVGYIRGMVKSVARLDYPRDRFELILLGDAETPLLQRARELAQEGGIALQVIHDPVAAGEKSSEGGEDVTFRFTGGQEGHEEGHQEEAADEGKS